MESLTFEKCRPRIGDDMVYYKSVVKQGRETFELSTKRFRGRLIDVRESNQKSYALFQRIEKNAFAGLAPQAIKNRVKKDVVPLEHIVSTANADSCRHGAANGDNPVQQNEFNSMASIGVDVIKLVNQMYTAATVKGMEIFDDVVWGHEWASPLIGKITWIGKRAVAGRWDDTNIIAVVQFDQLTHAASRRLKFNAPNRNMIDIKELLPLADWLEMSKEPFDVALSPGVNLTEKDHAQPEAHAEIKPVLRDIAGLPFSSAEGGPRNGNHVPQNYVRQPKISPAEFCLKVANAVEQGTYFGIQGRSNSCYMDVAIVSLFAFNNSLDHFVFQGTNHSGDREQMRPPADEIKHILGSEIILPLRKKYFVSFRRMKKLRDLLGKRMGAQYQHSFMDTEEFIITLFNLLNVHGLFTYNHGGMDHVHQILLPVTWEEKEKHEYLTVQYLLEDSFRASDVKLSTVPKSAFIIKLPVSDGKLIPCNAVVTTLTLDLSNVLEGKRKKKITMNLHAVICLRQNHFVTFVRMDHTDFECPWVFMDSKPTNSEPEVIILEGISHTIKQSERDVDLQVLSKHEPACNGYKLFSDAYMCVYVPSV